jgi:hypothetical protein
MKAKLIMVAVAMLVATGCATQTPTTRLVYSLDANQNLVANNVTSYESSNSNKALETMAIIGLGIVGLYFVGELFDVWDDDEPKTQSAPAPDNGLVQTGGSWEADYIQPVYQPL